jgi:hypothetical protein
MSTYCKSTIYFRRHNNMIYLLNFNITFIITLLHVLTLMSHLQALIFKNYCTYSFTVFMFYSFLSNYCNRDPFLHYKSRANVYMVLGRGVVGSCFWCPLLFVFGGWGVSRVGKSSGCTRLRLWYALVSNLDFVGMLVSRIGGGSGVGFRPFVVHPPSCQGGRFHTSRVKPHPPNMNNSGHQNSYQPYPSLIPYRH